MNRSYFEVTRSVVFTPDLDPVHDGLRVAQLSDIHIGPATVGSRIRAAVNEVNELEPDLVVLTGDYVTVMRGRVARITDLLGGIAAPAYGVLGNHDHQVGAAPVRRALERAGYPVLQNAHSTIEIRGERLTLLGVDDAVTRHDDVERTLANAPAGGSRLVLAHAPTTARLLPAGGGLICLSGHTHGGQIMIPRLTRALFRAARQPYLRGWYRVNGNWLYVNRGLGFGAGGLAPRFRSDPEVALFVLRRGHARPTRRSPSGTASG